MFPDLVIGGKVISAYMIISIISVLVMLAFGTHKAKKMGLDDSQALSMFLYSFIGVVVGSHLLYGITMMDLIKKLVLEFDKIDSAAELFTALSIIFGGSVYYGGLLGCLLVAFIFCKARKLPLGEYMDLGAMSIPLFHAIARLGCFFSGCCYGKEWEHGIVYHYSSAPGANGVPRFPVQAVESFLNLMLFFLLLYFCKKCICKHYLMTLYCTIYPVYRFLLEYMRDDEYRGFLFNLSTSQFISVLIFAGALIITAILKSKEKKRKQQMQEITA